MSFRPSRQSIFLSPQDRDGNQWLFKGKKQIPITDYLSSIGRSRWTRLNDKEAYVDFFTIRSPFRGQGYGRAGFEALEDEFKGQGIERIYLEPAAEVIQFWSELGFIPSDKKVFESAAWVKNIKK